MTKTEYVIVMSSVEGSLVARLLDSGYTLIISWVAGAAVHHILSKELPDEQ